MSFTRRPTIATRRLRVASGCAEPDTTSAVRTSSERIRSAFGERQGFVDQCEVEAAEAVELGAVFLGQRAESFEREGHFVLRTGAWVAVRNLVELAPGQAVFVAAEGDLHRRLECS
jgi:hypothetical protein